MRSVQVASRGCRSEREQMESASLSTSTSMSRSASSAWLSRSASSSLFTVHRWTFIRVLPRKPNDITVVRSCVPVVGAVFEARGARAGARATVGAAVRVVRTAGRRGPRLLLEAPARVREPRGNLRVHYAMGLMTATDVILNVLI